MNDQRVVEIALRREKRKVLESGTESENRIMGDLKIGRDGEGGRSVDLLEGCREGRGCYGSGCVWRRGGVD